MPKKAFALIFITIIAGLLLVDCQPSHSTSETDCGKPEVLCVGLVTDLDGVDDHSINQLAWEGMQQAQTEKIVDWVKYIETVDAKDYLQNITSFASAGYDIIVTVGEQNSAATSTAANTYSETLFVGVDQTHKETHSNLTSLVFKNDQTGFLAGALAAQVTKTGTIAGIFSTDLDPSIVTYKEGFEAGARYVNPNIRVITSYLPGDADSAISDAEWGVISASRAIQSGADVIFSAGGKVSTGALFETARYPGLYCIGVNYDQWETIPQIHTCLISSAVQQITPGVYNLLKLAKEKNFPTGNYIGSPGMAPYHDFEAVTAKTVKDKINQIITDLNSGAINIDAWIP